MKLIEVQKKHKRKFEEFVNNRIGATCMQMWEWCNFRNKLERKLYKRVGIVDDAGNFNLTATYAIHRFSYLGKILYIPQGPIWDNLEALEVFAKEIKKIGKRNNCFAVVCEPRVKREDHKFNQLINSGFRFTDQAVQPRVTVLLDLTASEDELLASFSKSTRYNIKYAFRKGVVIKKYNTRKDKGRMDKFYKLILATQKRKYFYIQDKSYFKELWLEFSNNDYVTLYEARFKDEVLGAIIVLNSNIWAASLFSSSSRKYSNLKPIYLARWESIKDAKAKGCKIYDFFGATKSSDRTHPFYYTSQHKLGFGRKVTEFSGTFEIVLNPLKYKTWRLFEERAIFKFYERTFLKEFKRVNVIKKQR